MARHDGEEWLKGGAIRFGGGPPEAPEEKRDYVHYVVVLAAAGVGAYLLDELPWEQVVIVAAAVGFCAHAVEWLVNPWFGRRRLTTGARILYGCLIAAAGGAGALLLEGDARTAAYAVGGALFAALCVYDVYTADPDEDGDELSAGASQSPDR